MSHQFILRTLATFLISTLAAYSSLAQSTKTEVEIIQEAFGLEKKVAVANFHGIGRKC